jgi:beta-1,4-mannosyl-glycoprotein beta-1,4-N-acetylglucosaminyltransferase
MAVYDCCLFFNENDIFEIRLNQHWDFVDKFVVVEAGETHTGLKKPLNFDHERFRPYADKIEYRSFDSFKDAIREFPEYYDELDAMVHDFKLEWVRDNFQGNFCFKVLRDLGAQDDDIVLLSPPDEMIRREAFEIARARFDTTERFDVSDSSGRVTVSGIRPIFQFCMRFYVFKFNLLVSEQEVQPIITQYGNHKKIFPSLARNTNISTHPPIPNGGWHFSYADDTDGERVLTKMKSWAHATDPGRGINGARRMDAATTLEAVEILTNEFNMQVVPIARGTHPDYIVDNQERFANYIFKE